MLSSKVLEKIVDSLPAEPTDGNAIRAIAPVTSTVPQANNVRGNAGTALATKENIVGISRPKKLAQPPKVGHRLVYDGGRRSTDTVAGVNSLSMHVLFDDSMEPTPARFDDPEWMDYISFDD
jgi:hypothetical protein